MYPDFGFDGSHIFF